MAKALGDRASAADGGVRHCKNAYIQMNESYSIVVFPFLKTSSPIKLGGLIFKSTQDVDSLTEEQAISVKEIAEMLFLKDNLRIKAAIYAIVPFLDLNAPGLDVDHLINIHAFVTYFYGIPHETIGDPFLSSEHASMAVFSPGRVIASLVRPNYNVVHAGEKIELSADKSGQVNGYSGLYNFRHHFWVALGSRLYGPQPHITLNVSQDLGDDIQKSLRQQPYFNFLLKLLDKPEKPIATRIFTALRWYNSANREANDENASLVNLAIAFESLLKLPENNKTDRLVDAISLILGRPPRLDVWAQQFYDARSAIVHEGQTQQLHFTTSDSRRKTSGETYQPLLSYGRQVFRLCLGTLLFGSDLAQKAGFEEKLVTNHERFESICKILSDENADPCSRLDQIQPLVSTIGKYRFVAESNLKIETMIGATRLATKTLLSCNLQLSPQIQEGLSRLINAKRTKDHFHELEALKELDEIFQKHSQTDKNGFLTLISEIVHIVWHYVFMYYFWVREQQLQKS